mmetsp:Transcript_48053/g.126902  ORF Transcript_48053/g.126902 Transcript_48053/m.126902 type:complete len:502 (+) Transcript_48053:136-1641(+)
MAVLAAPAKDTSSQDPSVQNEASPLPSLLSNPELYREDMQVLDREYTWPKCIFMVAGLSLCITVDILQYSMPLAFLPSVLEDRGHRPMVIATAIGIYYWTGFAGGACITSYQISKLFQEEDPDDEVVTVQKTARRIKYLIIGLGCGTVTLMAQAYHPHCQMHTACRFVQGAAGAFIFFYGFLLSVEMFSGPQQVFAMTSAATALNIAEVLGSTMGAYIYDSFGEPTVYAFLGVVSILNQVFLVAMLFNLHSSDQPPPKLQDGSPQTPAEQLRNNGWKKLKHLLKSKVLAVAVMLIVSAALIKASVEEILPFHADHRWGYDPLKIGELFSVIALAYIGAAIVAGNIWTRLGKWQVGWSSMWLVLLGLSSWCVFLIAGYYKRQAALKTGLALYGICLGMTHTPAALFLADAIEREEGKCKDAANGIWNTMWEAGGSIGFLLGGFLAEDYEHQVQLMGWYVCASIGSACLMMVIMSMPTRSGDLGASLQGLEDKKLGDYGSTTA